MKTYVVGGFVRDSLLGLKPNDIDYVVEGSSEDEMDKLYPKRVGKDFPVWLNDNGEEVALTRKERSTGPSTNDFAMDTINVPIEDDLKRRDFTMNAIAVPVEFKDKLRSIVGISKIIDPCNGLDDINNCIIRHCSDAFSEDPLRVLRAARFYGRYKDMGFIIAAETMELCQKMVQETQLSHLPDERIWNEAVKTIEYHHKSKTYRDYYFRDFCEMLKKFGLHNEILSSLFVFDEWSVLDNYLYITCYSKIDLSFLKPPASYVKKAKVLTSFIEAIDTYMKDGQADNLLSVLKKCRLHQDDAKLIPLHVINDSEGVYVKMYRVSYNIAKENTSAELADGLISQSEYGERLHEILKEKFEAYLSLGIDNV